MKLGPKIARVLYGWGIVMMTIGITGNIISLSAIGGGIIGFAGSMNWGEDD